MPLRCVEPSLPRQLTKEICRSAANDPEFVTIATYGMSSESLFADQTFLVILLAVQRYSKTGYLQFQPIDQRLASENWGQVWPGLLFCCGEQQRHTTATQQYRDRSS